MASCERHQEQRASGPGPNDRGGARPAPEPAKAAAADGPKRGRIGAASTHRANVSVKGVLQAAAPPPAKPAAKGMPILPFAARPSLAQTLGHAPIPSEEFAAVMAGAPGRISLLPDSAADAAPHAADPSPAAAAAETAASAARCMAFSIDAGIALDEPPPADETHRDQPLPDAPPVLGPPRAIAPSLAHLIQAWPDLPPHIRAAIAALIEAGRKYEG